MKLNVFSPAGAFNSISIKSKWHLEHFHVGTDCNLTDKEQNALAFAHDVLADYLKSTNDPFLHSLENVSLLFACQNSFTLSDEVDPDAPSKFVFGRLVSLIVLPVYLWRHFQLSELQMAAVILEEICHYAYCIDDETQVKQKVMSILRLAYPALDFTAFYNSFPGTVNFE